MYLAKDFIETKEGLIFAVVESGWEQSIVLCFLRYVLHKTHWQKVNTEEANTLLAAHHPQYLYYSTIKQAHLHAVSIDKIHKHYRPQLRLKQLLSEGAGDSVEDDLIHFCNLMKHQGMDLDEVGVTGSILIGAQRNTSDIDLVFYNQSIFNQARESVKNLIQLGECVALNEAQWQESYQRRKCDLSYSEYQWHERRKFNKTIIRERKVDLSLVINNARNKATKLFQKMGSIVITAQISDETQAFHYPAEYKIKHESISAVISYTATYTGQAKEGEWVEVAGLVEKSSEGEKRMVVGSTREAKGEYIKVINV